MTIPEENAALVRRFLMDVIAGGDTDAIDTFLSENVTDYNPVFENERTQEPVTTLGWRVLAGADIDIDIDDVIAAGDRVAVRGSVSGIHRESLMDLAPTGASFQIAYVWFCRIDNARISEIWSLPNGLGLMQQLGAIPEPMANQSLRTATEYR